MPEHSKRGGYILNYAKRNLSDDNLRNLHRDDGVEYVEVDFSENSIGAKGLKEVASICKRACKKLKVLKLYKNQIRDGGAQHIADVLNWFPYIEEMHLSHNQFGPEGIEIIVQAAHRHRPKDAGPLWLRLESNDIHDPEGFTNDILRDKLGLSVCTRGGGDQRHCNPRECRDGCRVHLPFFIRKGKGKGKGKSDGKGKGGWDEPDWRKDRHQPVDRWERGWSPPNQQNKDKEDRWSSRSPRGGPKSTPAVVLTPAGSSGPPPLALTESSHKERRRHGSASLREVRDNGREKDRGRSPRRREERDPPMERGRPASEKEHSMIEAARMRRLEKERDLDPDREAFSRRRPADLPSDQPSLKKRRIEREIKAAPQSKRRAEPHRTTDRLKAPDRRSTRARDIEIRPAADRGARGVARGQNSRPGKGAAPGLSSAMEVEDDYSESASWSEYTEQPPPPPGSIKVTAPSKAAPSARPALADSRPAGKSNGPIKSSQVEAVDSAMSDVESGCSSGPPEDRWAQDRGCSPPEASLSPEGGVGEDDGLEEYSESEDNAENAAAEDAQANAAGQFHTSRMEDLKKRLAQHWSQASVNKGKKEASTSLAPEDSSGKGEQKEPEDDKADSPPKLNPAEGRVLRRLKKP